MLNQGLDNKLLCALPEGVSINLQPAGFSVRVSAYLIDLVIRGLILTLIGIASLPFGKVGFGIMLLGYFVITWGYYILFESLKGQTPGKKRYKLRIVQDNGLPAHFSHIVTRNLLRVADSFPFAYLFGILSMVSSKQFKRIGDWAAGTMVVYDEPQTIKPIEDGGEAIAPNIQLSTEEQLTVIEFAQRSEELSQARQVELAAILSKQLDVEPQQANELLKAYARHYAGQAQLGQSNEGDVS